jgi:hypothetical protein
MPKRIGMKIYMINVYYLRSANLKRRKLERPKFWCGDSVQMIHKDCNNVIEDRD